jgi:chaperonin cofactor prefoldin
VLLALGILLGAGLALAVLFALNGTLDFGHHERLIYLNSWVTDLDRRVETAQDRIETQDAALKATQTELETLRGRLDEGMTRLETLNAGLSDLTDQAEALARDVEETTARLAALAATTERVTQENAAIRSQFEDINNRLAALNESAARFRDFLRGLQTLLNDLVAVPPATSATDQAVGTVMTAAPEEAITGSPALTLFPPLTPIPPPAAGQSHIFGLVWRDANGNGLPEKGEAVVVGAVVVLAQAEGGRLAATLTGADGRYRFTDLVPGAYVVSLPEETTPPVSLVAGADEAVEVNIGLAP